MINRTTLLAQSLDRLPLIQEPPASRGEELDQQNIAVTPTGATTQQVPMNSTQLHTVSTDIKRRLLRLNALQQHSQQVTNYKLTRIFLLDLEGQAQALRQRIRDGGGLKEIYDDAREHNGHHVLLGLIRVAEQQAKQEQAASELRALRAVRQQIIERIKQQPRPIRSGIRYTSSISDPRRRDRAQSLTGTGLLGIFELTEMISEREDEGTGFNAQLSDFQMETNHFMATAKPQQQLEAMKNLERTTFLKQFYRSCDHVLSTMLEKNPGLHMKTSALVKSLQQLISNGMQPSDTLKLVQSVAGRQLEHQVALVNRLLGLLRELKYMTWNDDKSRRKALENLLLLSTALVNEEQKRLQEALA